WWLVFAGSTDKDVPGMFRALAPHFAGAFLTRYTSNLRAIPPEQLASAWAAAGGAGGVVVATPAEALAAARAAARPGDLDCIAGAVSRGGELRPQLVAPPPQGA